MNGTWRFGALAATLCIALAAGCAPSTDKPERSGMMSHSVASAEIPNGAQQPPSVPAQSAETIPVDATTGAPPDLTQPPSPANQPLPDAALPSDSESGSSRFPEQRVTLMAVGDIMVHDQQLEAAWDSRTNRYDFLPSFVHVKPLFQEADWVIGNLETTLAGREARYTGYPMFNSPETLALTLKEIGFTAVTTANNHSLDRKEEGVHKTIAHLDQAGLLHTGTFRSEEERKEPLFLQKGEITLALLAYTYGTNGIPVPKGKPYLINLIDPVLIRQDILAAREKGADLVAVALHFGSEYQRLPNEAQKKTAEQVLRFGADLILGAHPHVVQPYEWKTVILEDGREHKGLIAYSLGNFISAQRWDYKDVGAILKLALHKGGKGETRIESVELIPTYVYFHRANGKRNYVIHPVWRTLENWERGEKDPTLSREAIRYMQQLAEEIPVHVDQLLPKEKAS